MSEQVVLSAYQRLWPEGERIRDVARWAGGARRPRLARDYLALDLLNGGLREVWALADALHLDPGSHALELGCGLGGPARFIAERHGCSVTGLDLSPRQLAGAGVLTEGLDVASRLRFVNGNAERLPFADNAFSHVYSIEAFIHVEDKPRALREAFRVLRPGGRICLHDPIHDPALRIAMLEGTLKPIPIDGYRDALEAAGFTDVSCVDRTELSRERYGLLARLVAQGPLSPLEARHLYERLHPGVQPPLRRFASPGRFPHVVRYMRDRGELALDLLETPERLSGVRRMCRDIVEGYDRGEIRFFQVLAFKPDG
jgi:SAM-dependent methyltransferase